MSGESGVTREVPSRGDPLPDPRSSNCAVTAEARFPLDDFELYHQAREFRKKVYRLIRQLPPQERYCLDPQTRKAAVSITNNLAEGHGRWHHQETIQFCRVSRGSVEEILDDVNVCLDEGYGDETLNVELKQDGYALILKINSYIAYLRKRRQGVAEDAAEYASPDER